MHPSLDAPSPSTSDGRLIEPLLDQFDQEWHRGAPPRIDALLARVPAAMRTELLHELIKLDLEYRWRQADPVRLEWYVQQHPELGAVDPLPIDLIAWEYLVRHRLGDRPPHPEYAARFPRQQGAVAERLARIDADLRNEFTRAEPRVPPAPAEHTNPVGPAPGGPALASAAGLLAALRELQLLTSSQLEEMEKNGAVDLRGLAGELIRREWLTAYQVNRLVAGCGRQLIVGPYVVLQRLGEGGAGQVFKAQHRRMGRLVALKVIRHELVAEPEAVARFRREIEILSRLDHPNVVHGYDAGPFGDSYFLAMEYVEGTDLAKLVKQCGPLPVLQACAYARQAALGLQHAHERGLVHRDIKPHNLILSVREGRIKVADLGLARLPRTAGEEATAALTGHAKGHSLTPAGAVMMGTLDYLAPEQALDFRQADIRADIYSLGCTLWFLLTGQPPFAGGTLAEKLLAHQSKELPAIERLRPDVPPGLSGVLRRMLAKRPEDRYRTPGDVDEALLPYISGADARELGIHSGGWSVGATAASSWELLRTFARLHKVFTAAVMTAMVFLLVSLVLIFQAWRRTEEAVQKFQKERERTLAAVPSMVVAARVLANTGQLKEAREQVELALMYDPRDADGHLLRAQILLGQKDWRAARVELDDYVRQRPNDVDARRLLELCTSGSVTDVPTEYAVAQVLAHQNLPGPAIPLLQDARRETDRLQQVLAVYQKQVEANWPGLGKRLQLNANGQFSLNFRYCRQVSTLVPLRGMQVSWLNLDGTSVRDLTPLRGMPLKVLDLGSCQEVQDLTPLRGLPLRELFLFRCDQVSDLSPLKGLALERLQLNSCTRVKDLTPLQGMKLAWLDLCKCPVQDLTPLKGMPLNVLELNECGRIADLTPLKDLPLRTLGLLHCLGAKDLTPLGHLSLTEVRIHPYLITKGMESLRSMKSLKTIQINEGTSLAPTEFWKRYDKGKFK